MLLSFVSTNFQGLFEARAEIQKYSNIFVHFLVQIKTLEFAFEIK